MTLPSGRLVVMETPRNADAAATAAQESEYVGLHSGFVPAAAPSRKRGWIVRGGVAAVGVGIAIGAGVAVMNRSSSQPSEAAVCNQVQKGARGSAAAAPGASVTVTPGGTAVADMPTLPPGVIYQCTMRLTQSGRTLTLYAALYDNTAARDSYQTTLQAAGYTLRDVPVLASTSSTEKVFADAAGRHVAVLMQLDDHSLVGQFTVPTG